MKNIIILLTFLCAVASYAVAPYGVKGQAQPGTLYSNVHQFPNNQVTNLGGINALVETGNTNLLANPSFEHSTVLTSWLPSFGPPPATTETPVEELTTIIDGKKSLKFVPSSEYVTIYQDSTLYAANFADSVHGAVSSWVHNTSPNLYLCARRAGILVATSNGTSITNCLKISEDGKWNQYVLPVILGGTSNGVALISLDPTTASTTTTSGTTYVDSMRLAAGDLRQSIPAIGPWTSFTPTGSWTTNTTYTGKYRQVGQNLEVQYYWTTSGAPNSATLTLNLPSGFTIDTTNMPASPVASSVGRDCVLVDNTVVNYSCATFYTNTTSFSLLTEDASVTSVRMNTLVSQAAPFTWGSSDYGTITVKFPVTQFSSTVSTYSSQNADTDWASCGHTTSDFTGFGTVTAIETQCKRQGSDLLMRGKFTSGTSTAVEARLNLKLNGAALMSADTSKIPSIQIVGQSGYSGFSTVFFTGSTLIEPSKGYITFGVQNSTTSQNSKANGPKLLSSGQTSSFNARIPIAGWENSNQIIGSFKEIPTTIGSSGVDLQSVYFGGAAGCTTACTTGTCYICNQVGGKITSVTREATGQYNINGVDGTKYNCLASGTNGAGTFVIATQNRSSSDASKAVLIAQTNLAYAPVICIGIP